MRTFTPLITLPGHHVDAGSSAEIFFGRSATRWLRLNGRPCSRETLSAISVRSLFVPRVGRGLKAHPRIHCFQPIDQLTQARGQRRSVSIKIETKPLPNRMADGLAVGRLQRRRVVSVRFHHGVPFRSIPKANISARNVVLRVATARRASTGDKCMAPLFLRAPVAKFAFVGFVSVPTRNFKARPQLKPNQAAARYDPLGICSAAKDANNFGHRSRRRCFGSMPSDCIEHRRSRQ